MEVVIHGVKGLVLGVAVLRHCGFSAWPGLEGMLGGFHSISKVDQEGHPDVKYLHLKISP